MVHLHTLGTSAIDVGTTRVGPASERLFAVLLYVAAERGRRTPRATLQRLLYPRADERSGSHCLRQLLYEARKLGAPIESKGDHVVLPDEVVVADYEHLERFPNDAGDWWGATGVLPGFAPEGEELEQWLERLRSRIALRAVDHANAAGRRARESGAWGAVAAAAECVLALDSLNETATIALAEALTMSGSRAKGTQLLARYAEEVGDPRLRKVAESFRSRLDRITDRPAGLDTPVFVGRQQEMATALACLDEAQRGTPRCLLITGEPGIGKTRLAEEIEKAAVLRGFTTVSVGCTPYSVNRPLGVVADLLSTLMVLPGALGCSPDALAYLRRITSDAEPPLPDNGELSAALVADAVCDLLGALSHEQPALLKLDNSHWMDVGSQELLARVLTTQSKLRLALAVTARPSSMLRNLGVMPSCVPLELTPLTDPYPRELIARQAPALTEADARCVCEASNGNPLLLLSLAQDVLRRGSTRQLPETLAGVYAQRLAVLPDPARSTMLAVAVLRPHATVELVESVLQIPSHELLAAVRRLSSLGLLHTAGGSLVPIHDAAADATLAAASAAELAVTHRRCAIALEGQGPLDSDPRLTAALNHWVLTGDTERAAKLAIRCARHARAIGDVMTASRIADDCIVRAGGLVPTALYIEAAAAALSAYDPAKCLAYIARARASHEVAEDEGIVTRLESLAADARWIAGNSTRPNTLPPQFAALAPEVAPDFIFRAVAQIVALDDHFDSAAAKEAYHRARSVRSTGLRFEVAQLSLDLAFNAYFGDVDRAIECAMLLPEAGDRALDVVERIRWRANCCGTLAYFGRPDDALACGIKAWQLADANRIPGWSAVTASYIADVHWTYGDIANAREWHARAAELLGKASTGPFCRPYYSLAICMALEDGNGDEAATLLTLVRDSFAAAAEKTRVYANVLAFEVLASALGARAFADVDLHAAAETLDSLYVRGLGGLAHDTVLAGLLCAGRSRSDIRYLADTFQNHVTRYRRERSPLAPVLRRVAASFAPVGLPGV